MKVFVTHAQSDEPLARQVLRALEQAGLEVWDDDRDIYPGDNWAKVTGEALEEADAMVVLLTPNALESKIVRRNILFATGCQKFEHGLIPVLVGVDPDQAKEKVPVIRFWKPITIPAFGRHEEGIDRITQALMAVA